MNDHPRFRVWAPLFGGVLIAVLVGVLAYNAGVSSGLAANPQAVSAIEGWRPHFWFHPFGFVFPLFFLFFWFGMARFLLWGGRRHHRAWRDEGAPSWFDAWHREAHDRMNRPPEAPGRS